MITKINNDMPYDQWILNRNKYIGASEIGVIVYGNKYTSNLELFYRKIGNSKPVIENVRMFLGKETEDISAKCWKHYEGNDQSVVDNVRKDRKVKDCQNLNSTFLNEKYPHLAATPDREILPYGVYEGMGKGSLEIKNTTSWVLNSYETGLPTDNVIQLCAQMMVCEYEYGELFYFIDNAKFESHSVTRSETKNIEEIILSHTIPFWDNVLKARPLYNQMFEANRNFNKRLASELQREIYQLEPPPQNTDGYLNYINARYKEKVSENGIIKGNEHIYDIAIKHKDLSSKIKMLNSEKMAIEIELKNFIKDNNKIDFGNKGYVSWSEGDSGRKTFLNKAK